LTTGGEATDSALEAKRKLALDFNALTSKLESSLRMELSTVHDRVIYELRCRSVELRQLLSSSLSLGDHATEDLGDAGAFADWPADPPGPRPPPRAEILGEVSSSSFGITGPNLDHTLKSSSMGLKSNFSRDFSISSCSDFQDVPSEAAVAGVWKDQRSLGGTTVANRSPRRKKRQNRSMPPIAKPCLNCGHLAEDGQVSATSSPSLRPRPPHSPKRTWTNATTQDTVMEMLTLEVEQAPTALTASPAPPQKMLFSKFVQRLRSMTTPEILSEQMSWQVWATRMIHSWQFECLRAVFSLASCATMGLQAHQEVSDSLPEGWAVFIKVSDHATTTWFLGECLLIWAVLGIRAFRPDSTEGRWNLMDAFLVLLTCIIPTWLLPLIALVSDVGSDTGQFARTLVVFRAIRLARLMRIFREVALFKEAWLLIRGLGDSSRVLFWTVVVIMIVTYGFAVVGCNVIGVQLLRIRAGSVGPEDAKRLDGLLLILGGMDRWMFTMVQVLLGDSFHDFVRDIIIYVPLAWMYFYAYIAVACLVLMNLVTAIIVENAMENAHNDHEQVANQKHAQQEKETKRSLLHSPSL